MENFSIIILISFLKFASTSIASEQPPYVPTDNITLNCGASSDSYGSDGRFWAADKSSKFCLVESSPKRSEACEADDQDGCVYAFIIQQPPSLVRNSCALSQSILARSSLGSTFDRLHVKNWTHPRPLSVFLCQRRRAENMGESRRIWGGFNSGIQVLMVTMLLSTSQQHFAAAAVKKNKSISNQLCDDSNKDCLLPKHVNMELLMDSEASKRVYEESAISSTFTVDSKHKTVNGLDDDPTASTLFDRHNSAKSCAPKSDARTKLPPNCSPSSYSKDCHRFLKIRHTTNQRNGPLNEMRMGEDLEPNLIRMLQNTNYQTLTLNSLVPGNAVQKGCPVYTTCIAYGSNKAKCLNEFGCRDQLHPKT
ncbi:hypothetical protein DITRI_Ditri13aG0153100 [Diplodiscus trichospermus]